jgi:hypothetical protein
MSGHFNLNIVITNQRVHPGRQLDLSLNPKFSLTPFTIYLLPVHELVI